MNDFISRKELIDIFEEEERYRLTLEPGEVPSPSDQTTAYVLRSLARRLKGTAGSNPGGDTK